MRKMSEPTANDRLVLAAYEVKFPTMLITDGHGEVALVTLSQMREPDWTGALAEATYMLNRRKGGDR
jgi:hypothetical protein